MEFSASLLIKILYERGQTIKMLNGSKLQYIRRLRGLTQVYIADCIGVSERWISKVECENSPISEETYLKWLDALYGKIKPVKKVKAINNAMKTQPKKVEVKKATPKKKST